MLGLCQVQEEGQTIPNPAQNIVEVRYLFIFHLYFSFLYTFGGSEFTISQHFADGFDLGWTSLKPICILYERVVLVSSFEQVLSFNIVSCTLFSFLRSCPLLSAVEVQEVRGSLSRALPLMFITLEFLELSLFGSTLCIRLLGSHHLWIILLTVVDPGCAFAAHFSICLTHVYSFIIPLSNMIFTLREYG